ncbi:Na+/H+ antiporter NhaC family protein [Paramaledivibacter caminithermalis]|uniref:Transporter, NhaC family n=1 Tax=Paramaledivibacter caminithermalis (strain DSM 15212 / CIP 107654 / DViRD3) TaxID=1121301 RepID=A0A1M6QQ28_PARC5|nr:Na+/H+ antiporter NhaC family protein [Paramaledivibacter caminithermalis]SHK22392.1 transporter, NhaC family [Paramaledivibacter caminithermalis DSM 15212]
MSKDSKKLEFYGGEWMSFVPFIVFLVLIILTTFVFGSISNGALWIPAFMALIVAFFFAKDKKLYSETIIKGMSSKEAIIPVVCWIFAGVFSRILRESGLAAGIAGLAANLGMSGTFFIIISFLASALFATASGTGFGTIAAGMGVLYPAGVALGAHPALLAGAIVSGGAFGDNLAPVSDTTICSATSQGVDVPGVVRSRLKYALTAGAITLIGIIIFGMTSSGSGTPVGAIEYDSVALLMLIPVAITIYVAIKSGDIIIATTVGIVLAGFTAVVTGIMDFVQIDPGAEVTKKALFRVVGSGLDRTVDGVIYTGINSMIQVVLLAILLFGSIAIMREGHGDVKLLKSLGKIAKTPRGSEFTIAGMIISLSALMGLNAPAILAVGGSFAKPLSRKHGISPYRTANLLDATSCTLVYSLPWTPAIIYTIGFTKDGVHPLTAMEVTPFVFYAFAMLAVMLGSIVLGIGKNDNMKGRTLEDFEEKATK